MSKAKICTLLTCIAAMHLSATLGADAKDGNDVDPRQTSAKEVLILDGETDAILLEKEADKPFPPASLAKLMTMEIVFGALQTGDVTASTEFPVTEHAWRTGGAPSGTSTMFAALKSSVPVDALVKGTIIQAANDAAIILAEGLSGSEARFAERMNERAGALGLKNSHFVNPTGLPAEGQQVTARDLVQLARHIEHTYPELYALYAQPEFEWNGIRQRNRNPLLRLDVGATGMGTGFTEEGGYALVGVTRRADRETFIVLGGLESDKDRANEAKRLLDWVEATFERKVLLGAKDKIGTAAVYGGTNDDVSVVLDKDVVAYIPRNKPEAVKARFIYNGPLRAPIGRGQKIGQLEVSINDQPSVTRDLFAGEDVVLGNFPGRALGAMRELAFGWIRQL